MNNFYTILTFLWILANLVYILKFIIPQWDFFTRFGKLENKAYNIPSISNNIGWILFYSFSCIMFFTSFLINYPPKLTNNLLLIHSSRRLLESIFITKFSNRKMHFINFFAGLIFYFMAPLSIAIEKKKQKSHLFKIILTGFAIMFNIMQFQVHFELSLLEKYSIPKNPLFTFVASPHYLFEIFLYFIYFILSPGRLTLLMLIFVCLNLTHQATMTYDWYKSKFGEEFISLNRSIIFPGIY